MKKTLYTLLLCLPALLCACSAHNDKIIGEWESMQPQRLTPKEGAGKLLSFQFYPNGAFNHRIMLVENGMPMATAMVIGEWKFIRGTRLRNDFTALVRLVYNINSIQVEAMSPAFRPNQLRSWQQTLASQFTHHNEIQDTPAHNQPVYALRVTLLNDNLLMIDTPEGNVKLQRTLAQSSHRN